MYFHSAYNSHVLLFRCEFMEPDANIQLSSEHSEYRYFDLDELSVVQHQRIMDCLNFDGEVKSRKF